MDLIMDILKGALPKMQTADGTLTPLSSEDYELEKIKWENAMPGNLSGEHCPLCLNRGYIRERQNGVTISRECSCMSKRRSLRLIRKSGLGDMLERYTFENYQTPEPWQQTAKKQALAYVSDHDGWFVAAGTVGSGKTHLCTAICGAMLDAGLEVRYMLWRDHGVQIKAVVNDSEAYSAMVEPLKRVKVLYIDDLFKTAKGESGTAKVTTGDINLAFELLNSRYNRKDLVTIISTELTIGQIVDIDEAVGSRIYERSKGCYLRIEGQDKNWRLRKG